MDDYHTFYKEFACTAFTEKECVSWVIKSQDQEDESEDKSEADESEAEEDVNQVVGGNISPHAPAASYSRAATWSPQASTTTNNFDNLLMFPGGSDGPLSWELVGSHSSATYDALGTAAGLGAANVDDLLSPNALFETGQFENEPVQFNSGYPFDLDLSGYGVMNAGGTNIGTSRNETDGSPMSSVGMNEWMYKGVDEWTNMGMNKNGSDLVGRNASSVAYPNSGSLSLETVIEGILYNQPDPEVVQWRIMRFPDPNDTSPTSSDIIQFSRKLKECSGDDRISSEVSKFKKGRLEQGNADSVICKPSKGNISRKK
ncbi:hypothetical protein V5O48_014152 [Marasmius crinis-equi]|uniref:Uncharacterized protein n=1 Tax=Marasmius crinis-equi TaxID=585013 RepID=A0ABR3EY29_9AGAR